MIRYLVPVTLLLFASCGSDPEHTESKKDSVADTVAIIDTIKPDSIPVEALALSMGGDTIAPSDRALIFYTFDKKMLDNKRSPLLTVKQVKQRFAPLDPSCDGEASYTFQRFFYLDSLRRIGEEPPTDMGQTVTVEIREYDTIKKTPEGAWVAWTMFYETTQACPYATGTYFMLSTYDAGGKLVSTQCMGRDCGGADAPMTWTSVQTCNVFTDGSFRALLSDTSGDMDTPNDLAIMRKTFTGTISSAGKITTTEKEIERNQ